MSSGGAGAGGSGSESGGSSVASEAPQLTQRAGESKQQFTERKQAFESMQQEHVNLLVAVQVAEEVAMQVVQNATAAVKASEQRLLDAVLQD